MVILKGLPFLVDKISNGRFVPEHYEQREIWHMTTGPIAPLWIRKLVCRDKTKECGVPEGDVLHITLPTHTKDEKENGSRSSHEMAGVHHQIVEVPRNNRYDV